MSMTRRHFLGLAIVVVLLIRSGAGGAPPRGNGAAPRRLRSSFSDTQHAVTSLPGWTGPLLTPSYTGYINVSSNDLAGGSMFYWLFEAESSAAPADTPLIVWLNGGPGCSSLFGAFNENGPYTLLPNGSLAANPFSWTHVGNVLYIDNPVGTGFSVPQSDATLAVNELQVASDLYDFLQQFLAQYPALRAAPLFLAGESYAGKYIPPAAVRMLYPENYAPIRDGEIAINLQGIMIGNGFTDPASVALAQGPYAFSRGIIGASALKETEAKAAACAHAIKTDAATADCTGVLASVIASAGGSSVNPYDVRNTCPQTEYPLCINTTVMSTYCNAPETWTALGIRPDSPQWTLCAAAPGRALSSDREQTVGYLLPRILEQARVLFYHGDSDLIIPFTGMRDYLTALPWPSQEAFSTTAPKPWFIANQIAGYEQAADGLTFLIVKNAGHMVPVDQPQAAVDMLRKFVNSVPITSAFM